MAHVGMKTFGLSTGKNQREAAVADTHL